MPEEDRRKVDALRAQLPLPTAMIQAHVTVKGSFDSPEDLEDVRRRMRGIASDTSPLEVELLAPIAWGGNAVVYEVYISPQMRALHDALYDAIDPISRNVYGPEAGDRFRPHMTVCQEMPEGTVEGAMRLIETLDIATRSRIGSMHLMGLVGPRHGGRWEVVEEFPFTG
jgi:2'-5' RNA ligase